MFPRDSVGNYKGGIPIRFVLDSAATEGSAQLYVRRGMPPTVTEYDATGGVHNQPDQVARLHEPVADTYYVAVFGQRLPDGPTTFDLLAEETDLEIRDVSSNVVGAGEATIEIIGDRFSPDAQVQLVAADATVFQAEEYYKNSAKLFATFDLAAAAPGPYDVKITNVDMQTVTEPDAVTVTSEVVAGFDADVIMQGAARPGRWVDVDVVYRNTGNVDILSPVLRLTSTSEESAWSLPWREGSVGGSDFQVMALSAQGPATMLRPGQAESLTVQMLTPFGPNAVVVSLHSMGAVADDRSGDAIDWAQFEQEIKPEGVDAADWDPVFANLQSQIGTTWGDYAAVIRENTERWFGAGRRVYCVRELFGMEMDEARALPDRILAGRVFYESNGRPVTNAIVQAWSTEQGGHAHTTTNPNGQFYLYGLAEGSGFLTIGGHTVVGGKEFSIPADQDIYGSVVLATEAAHVYGIVTTAEDGAPVEGAILTAVDFWGRTFQTVVTDTSGKYEFDRLPTGRYAIECTTTGLSWDRSGFLDVVSGTGYEVSFALSPAMTLSGTVYSAHDQTVVEEAAVFVYGWTTHYSETVYSRADGSYSINNLPADDLFIDVSCPGFVGFRDDITVDENGSPIQLDISLARGASIQGTVYGPQGDAISDAKVTCHGEGFSCDVAVTDTTGSFSLAGFPAGEYQVRATAEGLSQAAPVSISLDVDSALMGVDIHMVAAGSLGGSVKSSESGDPVASVTARIVGGIATYADFIADDGSFLIEGITPGVYDVVIEAPGFAETVIETVVVGEGLTMLENLLMPPCGRVAGAVRDTDSDVLLAGIKVDAWFEGNLVASAITDSDGRYMFTELAPGEYSLKIRGSGGIADAGHSITLSPGASVSANLGVATVATVTGSVLKPDGHSAMPFAQVYLLRDGEYVTHAVADADGRFKFYLAAPGSYDVAATTLDAAFSVAYGIPVAAGEAVNDLQLVAGRETISGTIRAEGTLEPIEGALVSISQVTVAGGATMLVGYTLTDEFGAFQYDQAVVGNYILTVDVEGWAQTHRDLTVQAGVGGQRDFLLGAKATIGGTISDAASSLQIEGAVVTATAWSSGYVWTTGTETTGHWRIDNLPPDEYDLVVMARGYRRLVMEDVSVPPGVTTVDVSLDAANTTITGTVADLNHEPIPGAMVWAVDSVGRPAGGAATDEMGTFVIDTLVTGTYDVRVAVEGFSSANRSEVTVSDGESLVTPEFSLSPLAIPDPPPDWVSQLDVPYYDSMEVLRRMPRPVHEPGLSPMPELPPASDCSSVCQEEVTEANALVDQARTAWNRYVSNYAEFAAYAPDLVDAIQYEENMEYWSFVNSVGGMVGVICPPTMALLGPLVVISGIGQWLVYDESTYLDLASPAFGSMSYALYLAEHDAALAAKYGKARLGVAGQVTGAAGMAFDVFGTMDHAKKAMLLRLQLKYLTRDVFEPYEDYRDLSAQASNAIADLLDCYDDSCQDIDPDARAKLQNWARMRLHTSYTPEDKYGPAGYDAPGTPEGSEVRFVPGDQPLDYRIEFWNKEDAPVPTQYAMIEDLLDPNVYDFDTLEFARVGFLKWDRPLPGGQAIDTRIDCQPHMNLAVEVKATFDPEFVAAPEDRQKYLDAYGFAEGGRILWEFKAVDPMTGDWPEDPFAGFLPPFNPETEYEIGWVEFTVDPLSELSSGTEVANLAYVEFDQAGDLYDHPAPKKDPDEEPAEPWAWLNTIDATPPSSAVDSLPATAPASEFLVSWSGDDDSEGSGIAAYDIYVSTDGQPYELWLDGTSETSRMFSGEMEHTYSFYSIAVDNVGHVEAAPTTPDAESTVPDRIPPSVLQVLAHDDSWDASFWTHLETKGLGEENGYAIPLGSSAQLNTLPWSGIDTVTVVFSEDVNITADDVHLYGVNTQEYSNTFSYDAANCAARLTLDAAIDVDKLLLVIEDTVADAAGNALDGEWEDGVSTVSGDGGAGGDFQFRFNVLPGDATDSGNVVASDVSVLASAFGSFAGGSDGRYSPFVDFDGSGNVVASDVSILASHFGQFLPSDDPTVPQSEDMATENLMVRSTNGSSAVDLVPTSIATASSTTVKAHVPPTSPVPASVAGLAPPESRARPTPSNPSPAASLPAVYEPDMVHEAPGHPAARLAATHSTDGTLEELAPNFLPGTEVAYDQSVAGTIASEDVTPSLCFLSAASILPCVPFRRATDPLHRLPVIGHQTGFAEPAPTDGLSSMSRRSLSSGLAQPAELDQHGDLLQAAAVDALFPELSLAPRIADHNNDLADELNYHRDDPGEWAEAVDEALELIKIL